MKKINLIFTSVLVSTLPITTVSCYNKENHTEVENFEQFVKKMPKNFRSKDLLRKQGKFNFVSTLKELYLKFPNYTYYLDHSEYERPYSSFLLREFQPNVKNCTLEMQKLGKKYLTGFGDMDANEDYSDVRFLILNKWQNSKKKLEELFKGNGGIPLSFYRSEPYKPPKEEDFKEWTKFINIDNLVECESYQLNDKIYVKNLLINVRLFDFITGEVKKDFLFYINLEAEEIKER